jgi:glycosyltransferase involved in cell wall biosynthesis
MATKKNRKVLTFNSHQPYLHLMAEALPWTLGVVTPKLPSGRIKEWNPGIRPLPDNVRLYSSVEEAARNSSWDWVLAHNITDLLDAGNITIPKVLLFHGTLSGRILQDQSDIDRNLYVKKLRLLLEANKTRNVYISELKRDDWGIPGDVILPGIDCSRYGGYHGTVRGILQVANHLKERGAMMGWPVHRTVCRDLPSLVLGDNPGMEPGLPAGSWEELKEYYRKYRVYLYTPVFPYEDGYNLAMLEAMASGMPVAALEHKTSPIRDGIEGVVAATARQLREKVVRILDDPEKSKALGEGARKRVETCFPISRFREAWEALAEKL